jgi:hypothetical protein
MSTSKRTSVPDQVAPGGLKETSHEQGDIEMKRIIAAGLAATALMAGAGTASAHNGHRACEDHAPRAGVVRVHLRCGETEVGPRQRFDLLIGRLDAPERWQGAWGGDGSLAWADAELDRYGCGRHVWSNGNVVMGVGCDH